jgi:hypothetical protein
MKGEIRPVQVRVGRYQDYVAEVPCRDFGRAVRPALLRRPSLPISSTAAQTGLPETGAPGGMTSR